MRRIIKMLLAVTFFVFLLGSTAEADPKVRRLPVTEYVSKMKAGWIGQMAGVGWGGPTEWKKRGEIFPENQVPVWKPGLINQFEQDDIYVEMTFLRTLEVHGLDVSIRQAGIDFANSGYRLHCANNACAAASRRPIRATPGSTSTPTTSITRSRPTIRVSSRRACPTSRSSWARSSGG